MSRIRAKDTKPEMVVRKYLHSRGLRYRLHVKQLPGKPDLVLPKYHTVIFVHGCFWHGHAGCPVFKMPKSNTEFWQTKIGGNISRDAAAEALLIKAGYGVITIWECELSNDEKRKVSLKRLFEEITNEKK
jgi:DNA mismatch endonuclease (patch repair protein)